MGQEEYPLSLTEEYRCLDRQRDNKERNTPLLTINNERKIVMAEIEQRNMGERISPEEEERLMKVVVENNEKIIKLQKYMGELQIILQKKKIEETRSREKEGEEMDRWIEECRKRNEKEREDKE